LREVLVGARRLPSEIVVKIFHSYFTLGHTLAETGKDLGISESAIQHCLAPAREAFGIVKRMRFGQQQEEKIGYYSSGDERFQAAMLREIKAGREHVTQGVVTDSTPFTPARFSQSSDTAPSCPQAWESTER
jgi:hypothetical protein